MATLQTQQGNNHFEASILEDSMEVIEDTDRQFDAGTDIDIDLDLNGEVQPDGQDEYMGEEDEDVADADPSIEQYSANGHDDEMVDDDFTDGVIAQSSPLHDEELEDAAYIDPDYDDDQDTTVGHKIEDPAEQAVDQSDIVRHHGARKQHQDIFDSHESDAIDYQDDESAEEKEKREDELADKSETSPNVSETTSKFSPGRSDLIVEPVTQEGGEDLWIAQHGESATSQMTVSAIHEPALSEHAKSHSRDDEDVEPEIKDQDDAHIQTSDPVIHPAAEPVELTASSQRSPRPSPKSEPETHVQTQPVTSEEAIPVSSANAHPVVIVYQDSEISLFPPINQAVEEEEEKEKEERSSTYFLQDEELVGNSVQNLLTALRLVLGESIGEQDELIVDIEELDIHIREFSTDCSTTSLSEILNIYLHLQSYDGLHSPPPLYMNLTTQTRFPCRLESLLVAVAEKKGLSQIRSIFAVDEREQIENEDATSPNTQDHVLDDEKSPDQNDDISASVQDEQKVRVESSDGITQQDLTSYSETTKQAPPALETNHEILDEASTHESVAVEVDGRNSDSTQNGSTDPAPIVALHVNSMSNNVERPPVDDDDIIDYEDDNEPTHEISSGSSTLQGDVFDVDYDEDNANSTTASVVGIAEIQSDEIPHAIVAGKGKVNHNVMNDMNDDPKLIATNKDQDDVLENDAEFLQHPDGEDNEASSNGRFKRTEASRNIGRFSPPQHDAIQSPSGVTNNEIRPTQLNHEAIHVSTNMTQEQHGGIVDGGADPERIPFDEGQKHEAESNGKRLDHEAIDDPVHGDKSEEETTDDRESTEVGETDGISTFENGEFASEPPPMNRLDPSPHSIDQSQHHEDEDEITYEDEDEEGDKYSPSDLLIEEHSGGSSPGSHKRPRSLRNDDDALENESRDIKRIRSA